MEQHSARTPRLRPRRRTAQPASPEAEEGARRRRPERAAGNRPRAGAEGGRAGSARREWPPGARLTGLGCGLLATGSMTVAGGLDALLLNGDPTVYGICFLLVSAVCALWVRSADRTAAPIAAPIAFTAGLPFLSGDSDGPAEWLVELATALAVQAGWVYGGTLTAVLVVLARANIGRGPGGRRVGPGRARRGAGARPAAAARRLADGEGGGQPTG